jgi:hypothetical protein
MKSFDITRSWTRLTAGLAILAVSLLGDVIPGSPLANPFSNISARNAFNVRPVPPPPEAKPPEPAPPSELVKVSLAGLGNLGGRKVAFLVIDPKNAKPSVDYYTLGEGDTAPDGYNLTVVSVDEANDTVMVRNNGREVAMDFKSSALKDAAKSPPIVDFTPGTPSEADRTGFPRVISVNLPTPGAQEGFSGGGRFAHSRFKN